jgi:hypothetical protein
MPSTSDQAFWLERQWFATSPEVECHPRWSTRGNELMLIVINPEVMQDFGRGLG